jgi:hypothetical protein
MSQNHPTHAPAWQEVELAFTAAGTYPAPYTEVEFWADFTHADGTILRRPGFWDGGASWKIRFASPLPAGVWRWETFSNVDDAGLVGQQGSLVCGPAPEMDNRFYRHGFWRMSPGGRNLVHADGSPALLIGDTAWALPWRATAEQCRVYAADRQAKGFNAALLMTVQPDRFAEGPRSRTEDYGFDVGFEDLPQGHLNQLNPAYFQTFDRLVDILVAHEIAPVYQPVFHGYGWKGKSVAGPVVPGDEYARYCRYLVARYGARPAVYLVGGDGSGYLPQVNNGGWEVETWDCYQQPAGIHYRPHADNRAYQDQPWLDVQWCQTGHNGEHLPERVADMWRNLPVKAVANGEPTYEHIGRTGKAAGWWQGHEAWSNLCAGGTMGVVYGAGSLWQWKLRPDEPGHEDWCIAPDAGWREALAFEGSAHVGRLGKILADLPITDIQPDWECTIGRRGLLAPGHLLIAYLSNGGGLAVTPQDPATVPAAYRIVDPQTGRTHAAGRWSPQDRHIHTEYDRPWVVLFYEGADAHPVDSQETVG